MNNILENQKRDESKNEHDLNYRKKLDKVVNLY